MKLLHWLVLSSMLISGVAQAGATEDAIRKKIGNRLGDPARIDSITATPYSGLYEVRAGSNIIYIDKNAEYLFMGEVIDLNTRANITADRVEALTKIPFEALPLDLAFKTVKGNGKRVLAVFEDPNCGYCKRLDEALVKLNDVTIYTFMYAVLGPDSTEKSKVIWCSPDRSKTWFDWMLEKKAPMGNSNCNHPIDKIAEFGQQNKITGTPTLFFANGKRIPGVIGQDKIEELLAQAPGNPTIKK